MGVRYVEVNGRGVDHTPYLRAITLLLCDAAERDGKSTISFERYGDAPDRVGIPMKSFALVGDTWEDLEGDALLYDPPYADAAVLIDATSIKGNEPWGFEGLVLATDPLKEGSTLIVNSPENPDFFLRYLPKVDFKYKIATIDAYGIDPLIPVPLAGAVGKVLPDLVTYQSLEAAVRDRYKVVADREAANLKKATQSVKISEVLP
ncbi:MAG: hypothetical protein ACE5OY_00260 [Candidatus Bathyarchaeia archaeon]